ncbi:hypothetical protein PV416_28785 [Streptomyces ipomoeae]|uniref:hypothetical protein n=1 Tax=Streptomyces ipomoeae TaxID=103232 RepID=UPI0029B5E3D0|nr:hypothetical protein [Streptomyces ipomoeae]MDX2824978.1 hypothetical protein [Streptomyces ipomoeae]MDX2877582.1 hypothetical protein [Streptomyces ipomoeae]
MTVFRSNMILAHSRYTGQPNVHDMFSRLLFRLLATGVTPNSFYRTFSLVNPHDDGVSLDTFVEWLIEDGHGIERIAGYRDWLVRIEAALRKWPCGCFTGMSVDAAGVPEDSQCPWPFFRGADARSRTASCFDRGRHHHRKRRPVS